MIGALGATGALAAAAQATTYTVTSTSDSSGGSCTSDQCSTLRAALTAANSDTSADTIQFATGLTGKITLTNGALPISGSGGLTIDGPGSGDLAISGNNASQIFHITAPEGTAVTISGLTLTDGASPSDPGGAIDDGPSGGSGSTPLTLSGDIISDSTTSSSDGGGAVYVDDVPLDVTNSTVSGNTATDGPGGAIVDTVKYDPSTISDSTITGNIATTGGGIDLDDLSLGGGSRVTDNTANGTGSAGEGGGIVMGGGSIGAATISGNTASASGGGIAVIPSKYLDTSVSGATVSGNTAPAGGGLYIDIDGDEDHQANVDVEKSTISSNHGTLGAGVNVADDATGNVRIGSSTISGNVGATGDSYGGGLLVAGDVYDDLDVSDSTLTGNTATYGGGISLGESVADSPNLIGTESSSGESGSITIGNSTDAGNAAASAGGGIFLSGYDSGSPAVVKSGTAAIDSTIVSGNTAAGKASDLARVSGSTSGGFTSAYSLIETPGSAPLSAKETITGENPDLGPLRNNGGPTETMKQSGTSPVIDQGHAPSSLTTDQIGNPRTVDTAIPNPPGGDGTDIGAVELPASEVVPPTFTVSVRGITLGGSTKPLVVGSSTPVDCTVTRETMKACVIEVRSGGKLVASGEVTDSAGATALSTEVTPTEAGVSMLKKKPLGLTSTVLALAGTNGSPTVMGKVTLLGSSSITLPLSSGKSTKLPKAVVGDLKTVAKELKGAKSVTCTAYSGKGSGEKARTKSEAKAACSDLKKDKFSGKTKAVGAGESKHGAKPANRLVITFRF